MEELLEIQETEQQAPPDETPKQKLYNRLKGKGLYSKTYQEFETQFNNPESINKLYKSMYDKGLYSKSDKEFNSQFFSEVKKKRASVLLDESSLQAGNSLSSGVGSEEIPTIQVSDEEIFDPVGSSITAKELSKKTIDRGVTGEYSEVLPSPQAQKQSSELRKKVQEFGYDPEKLAADFEGLQGDYDKKDLLESYKTNPHEYERKLSRLNWRPKLDKSITALVGTGFLSPEDADEIQFGVKSALENMDTGSYTHHRSMAQSVANTIKKFGNKEILDNFAGEISKVYGNAYKHGFDKAVEGTPESNYLSEDAQLGYQYLQDLAPEKAEQYKRLFIDPKTLKDKSDEQKGYNHLMQTLEETGIGLQQNAVSEDLNNLKKIAERNGGLDPEQIQQATELEKKNDELAQKRNELDKKYPDRIENKVDDAVQELLGQRANYLGYLHGKAVHGVANTVQGVWEAVSTPFMSDASNNLRELAIMGENLKDQYTFHQTDKNKSLLTDQLVIDPELQAKIDYVRNTKGMSDERKESIIRDYLKNNLDKFGRVPIQNGKFNINPSSILYGLTDLGTGLLPFVAIEAATSGIGGAGAAAKFLRTFTAAAATTFHDEYAGALLEGKTQSDAYKSAMASTAINSMAMAGAGTPTAIREMAAGMKTSASKIIAQMSDAEIQKVLAKGTPKGLKAFGQSFKERAKAVPSMVGKGLETGARFEGYMAGANLLNDREVNFKQMLINTANFGILGGFMGQAGFKPPTQLQKSHGLEFGKNPDEFIEVAKEMRKNGEINDSELSHRVDLIERYGEAYKTLPKANDAGKPLTETQKAEYLYNSVIKDEGNKSKATLPPNQAKKAEHTALVADFKNGILLEETTDKKLQSRQNSLEKQLEQKDEEGKLTLPENERKEVKAELDAITETLETRKDTAIEESKGEPEKITQPIELSIEPKEKIIEEPKVDVANLEKERDAEIGKVIKPNLRLELVSSKDLVESKDPIGNREKHNELKERYKQLRKLVDCL